MAKKGSGFFKKLIRTFLTLLILFLSLLGLLRVIQFWQYHSTEKYSMTLEKKVKFDDDFLFREPYGKPVFWVNPSYTKTLFFFEGFRNPVNVEGWYGSWLRYIHHHLKVNIISPVYGLQGWPYRERNREWFFRQDMREALQIYDAYTCLLPDSHRVVVASMSLGTLPNLVICAKARRKPDACVLLSPLNSRIDFRLSGKLVAWIGKQVMERDWLSDIIMFTRSSVSKNRVNEYDIVNADSAVLYKNKGYTNLEGNVKQAYTTHLAAIYLEEKLIPQLKGMHIQMFWGDDDLYFSQTGFKNLYNLLAIHNKVKMTVQHKAGHAVLIDNGADKIWKRIEAILEGKF